MLCFNVITRTAKVCFATVGWLENEVYPGIPELLDRLCQAGKTMMVATSKPEVFARKILDHFQLAAYFSFVGGATLDGVRSTKEEVINYVLKTNEVVSLSEVIMVGDRKFDILGAKHAGVSSVGVYMDMAPGKNWKLLGRIMW